MAKKQFKTESRKILDLMINSIYINREIFLRELISNASDAMDKLYFKSLTNQKIKLKRSDYEINLSVDKLNRTITIEDNGIGMSAFDLEDNLGTIAKSGSKKFKDENAGSSEVEIIGQFGVGFYSAFIVAKKITVISKAFGEKDAYRWQSSGVEGYTIEPDADKKTVGTKIILELKENTDEDNYDEYLDEYRIEQIVKKYSDYIRYPIKLDMPRRRKKEGSDDYEDYTENTILNSMVPIWKRDKKEVSDEEYKKFYNTFYDNKEPLAVIHQHAEGSTEYYALMYIPDTPDFDYYTKEFERGLTLYTSNVMIMEKCSALLPEYFGFVKGLVDSQDLNLNISRETLQNDSRIGVIRTALEKRIKKELVEMMAEKRDKYEKFFESFGQTLKYGIYKSFGATRGTLEELLLFRRASDGKYVSLKEYKDAMPDNQEKIFYAAGDNFEKLAKLPQSELVRDKGFDILCLTDEVDGFLMEMLHVYDGKPYISVSSGDLGLETEEEKKELEEKGEQSKDLFECMKNALDGKVSAVRVSTRLKSHPVCLTSEGAISIEMEKVFAAMPGNERELKAQKVLEINANHPIFATLNGLFDTDREKLDKYSKLLYNQALLIEGLPVEDPVEFSNLICDIM